MVIGGRGSSDRAVEVVSLDPENPLPECLTSLADLPFKLDGGSGAALSDGTPLACSSHNSTCFKYKAEDDSWYATGDMIDERENAGYTFNNAMGLVMAGGQGPGSAGMNVESTNDGSKFQPLNPMPNTNYYHCLVSVDTASAGTLPQERPTFIEVQPITGLRLRPCQSVGEGTAVGSLMDLMGKRS